MRGVPDEPLEVVDCWAMGKRHGLWIGLAGSSVGQRWSVTDVSIEDAQAWLDAAQGRGT